jgi:hypothetical protein
LRIVRILHEGRPLHARPAWRGDIAQIEAVARSLGVVPVPTPVRNPADIERALAAFAGEPKSGVIILPDNTNFRSAM